MEDKAKPILVSGLVAGLLSGLPLIGWGWFLWALAAGFLAVHLFMKKHPSGRLENMDGIMFGSLAGAVCIMNVKSRANRASVLGVQP